MKRKEKMKKIVSILLLIIVACTTTTTQSEPKTDINKIVDALKAVVMPK